MRYVEGIALFLLTTAMVEGLMHDKPPPYAQTALVAVLVALFIWRQMPKPPPSRSAAPKA